MCGSPESSNVCAGIHVKNVIQALKHVGSAERVTLASDDGDYIDIVYTTSMSMSVR
jgi:hypothetical protein